MGEHYDHDIIVVGAGPAGLLVGEYAADRGADVLILDKKHELGVPVRCGEATIETIFHDFYLKPTKDIVANTVNSMRCFSSQGKKLEIELKISGYILNRAGFEKHLGERAKKNGAQIQLETSVVGINRSKVTITRDNGKTIEYLRSKIIIGADGVESRIGRWAGIETTLKPRDIGICRQYVIKNIEIDKKCVELYWGSKYSPHGYVWVFPKSASTANVGIITYGSFNDNLEMALDKFIKTRAPESEKLSQVTGCVPQANPPPQVVKENVMLVGDAARVALPVTGGGIGHAMASGKWAGEVAGEVVSENLPIKKLERYDHQMRIIRRKIARSYMLKEKIFRDDEFFELLFPLFVPFQYLYKLNPDLVHRFLLKSLRY